jgi:hypothetical protein
MHVSYVCPIYAVQAVASWLVVDKSFPRCTLSLHLAESAAAAAATAAAADTAADSAVAAPSASHCRSEPPLRWENLVGSGALLPQPTAKMTSFC